MLNQNHYQTASYLSIKSIIKSVSQLIILGHMSFSYDRFKKSSAKLILPRGKFLPLMIDTRV